ncbi:MAG TPA: galactose oxidase-like domain-containing protein [Nitrososphaera sp.]|nr:galactose oxidase-like domain-containing protein [Nitrososphaera sp.]
MAPADNPLPKVTRSEFLKFLVAGGIASIAGLAGVGNLSLRTERSVRQASAQTSGSWEAGPNALCHPVHLALLPSGKVLYVAGSGLHRPSTSGPFKAALWDPVTNSQKSYVIDKDIWCSGHATLPNGNILFAGGTKKYPHQTPNHRWWGINAVYEYDHVSEQFQSRPAMAEARWYPTVILLDTGLLQVVEGFDEFGYNNLLTEIYNPVARSWTIKYNPKTNTRYCVGCSGTSCANIAGAGSRCYGGTNKGVNPPMATYPRMHLLPSGLVACVGQKPPRRLWNPSTGVWLGAGTGINRSWGTSVLLPLQNTLEEKGSILVCGGANTTAFPSIATSSAEIVQQSNLTLVSRAIQPMNFPRRYGNPVILPNGKILIIGGTRENNDKNLAVYEPEMFDPVSETWTLLPPHSVPRIYHSNALLLTDGRVYVAGTSYSQYSFELRTEIYSPQYVFEQRPTISSIPASAAYGGTIQVGTPDAQEISAVSIVRQSSTTHHYNPEQRLVWLQVLEKSESSVVVSAPINRKLAPPGLYLLHVLNAAGIPSKAAMLKMA